MFQSNGHALMSGSDSMAGGGYRHHQHSVVYDGLVEDREREEVERQVEQEWERKERKARKERKERKEREERQQREERQEREEREEQEREEYEREKKELAVERAVTGRLEQLLE